MSVPKLDDRAAVATLARGPRRAAKLAAPAALDVQALFQDTMRRFPATMARLAE